MQCLRTWFTIWLFAISVNNSVASPVDILNVDNKNVSDLNIAASNQDEAVISERDNEVGYLRKEDEKGADAYQHFESFHDKDGDAYGYEKHEAFGKSNKGESLNDEKDKDDGSHYTYVQELGDKPKYQKYHGSIDDPGKSKQSNYHYSYNSEDDDEEKTKPKHSSSYKAEAKQDDSSEEEDDEENDVETDNNGTDEEKSTNFSYKIISDDYAEEDPSGDINSKGSGDGNGYHFGHGDKNTDVNYNIKKSDYTASDDDNDDDDDEDEDDDEGSEEEDEKNVVDKKQKIKDDQEKDKNTKSYSTYTTYNSQDGDGEDEDENDTGSDNKAILKHAVRYEKAYPINDNIHTNRQKIEEHDNSEENNKNDDDVRQIKDDVELHQPAKSQPTKPQPTEPFVLVKEHRASYNVENDHPTKSTPTKSTTTKSSPTKSQVIIQPSKPFVLVQEHHAGYKIEESDGGKGSDDSGKGHAGSVAKHLYEIYVTHDTGKSNGGGGGGGGGGDDSKGSGDAEAEGGGKGKSENLVLEQPQKLNKQADVNDNGAYKVNINYGKNKGLKKSGKRINKKHKGLKKKKIVKPHKYEVEEYIDHEEKTKQPIVAGKEASPQHHHRDSEDYSNGQQQFVYASEADSDAYYW